MRFKVGDKVIVKSFYERPKHWNIYGRMDHWMGKIVTIRDGHRNGINPYSIEEDIKEGEDYEFGWCESDFLPIPKPGDRVKIRTWEDMEKQYGLTMDREIHISHHSVVNRYMGRYCGRTVTVNKVRKESFDIKEHALWNWGFETIKEVYPKEEKMEFTKDMLKNGEHVVQYRDGSRRLYLNGYFVGPDSGVNIEDFNNDLKYPSFIDSSFDIVAIYKAHGTRAFKDILTDSADLIWERDEEPMEISATEALAQLREIYGKEVKIVEDKDD